MICQPSHGAHMSRFVLVALPLVLCGCLPGEPLSPDYAGTWVGLRDSCAKASRIQLSTRAITVRGGELPVQITLFSIQKAEVSGAVAQLTMQLEPSLDGAHPAAWGRQQQAASSPKRDIRVTLTAGSGRISPSNITVRDPGTGQYVKRSQEEEVATSLLTLQRCPQQGVHATGSMPLARGEGLRLDSVASQRHKSPELARRG